MEQLKLGWARREISVEGPVSIPGQTYMRLSEGIQDPLYVTALVVDGGEGQDHVVFCSCDIITLTNNVIADTCQLVSQLRPEINTAAIVMNATHTHSGCNIRPNQPSVSPDGKPIYPADKYREFFVKMCAEAIVEAWDNRSEGGIGYGYGYAVVAHTRRVCYFHDQSLKSNSVAPNGHCIMYGNTNDPDFSHYEGGADHFLNLMFTFDKQNKLTGVVVNVPCPSQVTEQLTRLSADYWHDVRQILTKKYGDIGILSQCAAAGDLAPRILHYNKAEERRFRMKYADAQLDSRFDSAKEKLRRMDIAQRICEAFDEVLSWAGKELIRDAEVKHSVRDISVPRRLVAKELYEDALVELPKLEQAGFVHTDDPMRDYINNTVRTSGISRYKGIIRRYEEQQADPNTKVELHTIRIGDIAFASNPFELYIDYQHRIQARSPFLQTFIVQLCAKPDGNYSAGYLATERAVANVGYSAAIYDNQVAPEGGTKLVEETLKDLNALI